MNENIDGESDRNFREYSIKSKIVAGLLLRFAERIGAKGVTFIVSIVLARKLNPSAYGIVALATIFTTMFEVFIDGGLGVALIQKKNADDLDFSSVFYFNVVLCFCIYVIIYFSAPLIADYYNIQDIILVVRVLGITVLISGVKNVLHAYVSREMMFIKFFFATLIGTIGAGILGIVLAYNGLGVWALVGQYLFNGIMDTIILWKTLKWKPKLAFSFQRLSSLFNYGWKIFTSNLFNTLYNNFRQLIIGRVYSATDLAFFNKAEQLPSLIVLSIDATIDSVLLPAMSNAQDNISIVKEMTRKSISVSTYILTPLIIGFAACGEPIIGLFYTEKWLPCTSLLQIICIGYMFMPIQTANMNAIKAIGRSDVFLKYDLIKKVIGLLVFILSLFIGLKCVAVGIMLSSLMFQFIDALPNKDLINYSYIEQLKDVFPSVFSAFIMGSFIYPINFLSISWGIKVLIQILLGITIYLGLSMLLKNPSYLYLKNNIVQLMHNKKLLAG